MIRSRLSDSVKAHEGRRLAAYKDHLGVWTIGYGTNLQTLTIDETTAERWLMEKLQAVRDSLGKIQGFAECSDVRQDVLCEMAYQLGVAGAGPGSFPKMWAAIRRHDWWAAASEMLDSKWAKVQTPARAQELAARMRSGEWQN